MDQRRGRRTSGRGRQSCQCPGRHQRPWQPCQVQPVKINIGEGAKIDIGEGAKIDIGEGGKHFRATMIHRQLPNIFITVTIHLKFRLGLGVGIDHAAVGSFLLRRILLDLVHEERLQEKAG